MKALLIRLPLITSLLIAILLVIHGPIAQLAHYHDFADHSMLIGMPHAADVLSNLGFALVALWGLIRLWPMRQDDSIKAGWHGYLLFLVALLLTAIGSGFYHLAPDNARLIWDRIPIALACAGLLAAIRAECLGKPGSKGMTVLLGVCAVLSVAWWHVTARYGQEDLRPYLLLQFMPLILIPMWQLIYHAPRKDKLAFGIALLLYALAKIAELNDHALLDFSETISGHTLKHLLATAAAACIVARLIQRADQADSSLPKKARTVPMQIKNKKIH